MLSDRKVKVKTPLVEMDGDEMTRIIWQMIKERLILPYLDVELEYYDLHVKNRDDTDDAVTVEAALAIKKHGVGVKCATITPDASRVSEYNLKRAWASPNATIRGLLDGTVFRKPILIDSIRPGVSSWKNPIVIGRHAYGDIYKAAEYLVPAAGTLELVFTPEKEGPEERILVHQFTGPGVVMGMHNTEESIRSFVDSCLNYAVSEKIDIWFSAKDTISKIYHARFRDVFSERVEARREELERAGVSYCYFLIDDAIAQLMKHEGGMLLALMNYDGDVWSDLLAGGFGSLGLMTSVLVSPDGKFEFEAAHGTVRRHYHQHLAGLPTSTNSVASIFAWSGALAKRGELDKTPEVVAFAQKLEEAVLETISSGIMTRDMCRLVGEGTQRMQGAPEEVNTEGFIQAVADKLSDKVA